jgi:hypothetical protein
VHTGETHPTEAAPTTTTTDRRRPTGDGRPSAGRGPGRDAGLDGAGVAVLRAHAGRLGVVGPPPAAHEDLVRAGLAAPVDAAGPTPDVAGPRNRGEVPGSLVS